MLSVHEITWDKTKKCHTCCGSTHSYHRTGCKIRRQNAAPGMASDPEYVAVQAFKFEGMNTAQIARRLNLPLEHVNNLFIL